MRSVEHSDRWAVRTAVLPDRLTAQPPNHRKGRKEGRA